MVDAVKNRAFQIAEEIQADYVIVDSAAGIGCPVIASVRGSDYVIMVTEPTPVAFQILKGPGDGEVLCNTPCNGHKPLGH